MDYVVVELNVKERYFNMNNKDGKTYLDRSVTETQRYARKTRPDTAGGAASLTITEVSGPNST